MPQAILIGGPFDGQRVFVSDERPKFLGMGGAENQQMYLENDVVWNGERIEDPVFVHTSIHRADLDIVKLLIAGYRQPKS